jgi:acetoin utilization protein AcuB
MTSPAITITTETPYQEAFKLMRERKFRRLPVVDKNGELVGIVSERDLLYASPSPATSLSVWELNYLLAKLKIDSIMTRDVITTTPDTPIEDAAQIMVEKKIGGLPVVDENNHVVGVITETDIFKSFVEMLGSRVPGLRLTLEVPERKGVLAQLSQAIYEAGGNIVSVGTFDEIAPGHRRLLVKVRGVSKDQLVDTLERLGDHVLDAREV